MGLLWKKPMNPYELTKLAELNVIQEWFPLTAQSIYTTIKNLERKKYITGEVVQEGNMPPKTVYSLTQIGEEKLLSDLLMGLESYEAGATDFGISIFHIGLLKQDDALKYAQKRLDNLYALLSKAQKRLDSNISHVPFNFKTMLTYNIYRIENEIKITKQLVEEIENATSWDISFVKFMKQDSSCDK
jgi:DNA-binding PadR family transcriptional regulator